MAVPTVRFDPQFLADPDALLAYLISGITWDTRMRARLTATFGIPYNYSGMTYPGGPFPEALERVLDALQAALGFRPNNCLANYYPTGESTMGFHADSTAELTPDTGVAVVSLGAERTLRFRRIDAKEVTVDYRLPSGSLIFMPHPVQAEWKHGVPTEPGAGPRISLTFRAVRLDLAVQDNGEG